MSPQQKAQLAARLAKVEAERAAPLVYHTKQVSLAEFKEAYPVNTEAKAVNTDRHKPGYMAEYMRKRRAAARVGKP